MRIIYAADNRWGAAYQLHDFIRNTRHEVKIAAYPKSGRFLSHIDWNLDAASHNLDQLQLDIKNYYPDCIIIDAEPIVANLANQLDLPIVYCSSLHLLDGLIWPKKQRSYSFIVEKLRRKLNSLPGGINKFIYAPYGDLITPPRIKNENFEWIQPYHVKVTGSGKAILSLIEPPGRGAQLQRIYNSSKRFEFIPGRINDESYAAILAQSSTLLIEGSTRQIADGIYNNKGLLLCPEITDAEDVLNAAICSDLNLGIDLGQIELAETLALDKIEKAIELVKQPIVHVINYKKLHERIDELWECV